MSEEKSRRGRKWLVAIMLIAAVASIVGLFLNQNSQRPDQIEVLRVDGESVKANEAMVYYKLMQIQFENMGTEAIWDLEITGLDPQQTAMDRVIESMIRIKIIQSLMGSLKENEEKIVQTRTDQLESLLGEEYMNTHYIDRTLLEKVVRENYKAYRYEKDAKFLPGSNEEEIQKKLKEAFSEYESLNQSQYLQSVAIEPMMFYTGEWVEGEWVSYSDAQKILILEEVKNIQKTLTIYNFNTVAEESSDSCEVAGNPVFTERAIQHPQDEYGSVYYGQMAKKTADIIFSTKIGEMTDIIDTEYGYLIVKIKAAPVFSETDYDQYEAMLKEARESYRTQLIEELKDQRLEEEWQRLEAECTIERFDEQWEAYVRAN